MQDAIGRLWNGGAGLFRSLDQISGAPIEVATSAGLLPLYAGAVDAARTQAMVATLRRWTEVVRYLVPSTAPDEACFDALRYWRGPIWAVVNWMIAEGLAESGEAGVANEVRSVTRELITAADFSEYFDPRDGCRYRRRELLVDCRDLSVAPLTSGLLYQQPQQLTVCARCHPSLDGR